MSARCDNIRTETEKLLYKIDEGLLGSRDVLIACLKFMSDDEVADMMDINEWSDRFDDEDYDDDDGPPDATQEWRHFDPELY
jgi:hypothetical protein